MRLKVWGGLSASSVLKLGRYDSGHAGVIRCYSLLLEVFKNQNGISQSEGSENSAESIYHVMRSFSAKRMPRTILDARNDHIT